MPVPGGSTLTLCDRTRETTVTVGTGTISLGGAVLGYQSFLAGVGNGNPCYYCISDQSGANWEVGQGTYTSSGSTLSRTTVLASSNSGSLVSFGANVKDVFVTIPAALASIISPTASLFTGTQAVTVANTASETTLLGTGMGSLTIPSTDLTIGRCIRFKATGIWSTLAALAGNLTLNFKAGSTVLATTGAIAVPVSLANNFWETTVDINVYTISGSGTMWVQGRMLSQIAANAAQISGLVNTATQAITPLSSALNLTAIWSVASTLNTITQTNVAVDMVN